MTHATIDSLDPVPAGAGTTCNVLLVFPLFNAHSFWALEDTCRIQGAKAPAPPLGLMTLAALLPQNWTFRLVNRNTEELQESHLAWADIVMTGGMLPQCDDTFALIELCKARGLPVAIGGPDATSRPEAYQAADFLVLGEVEGMIGDFVAAWCRGERHGRFEAPKFQADVTTTPIPRYDLIDFSHYLWVNLQFSRGCPFNCEFCDIIELYGRVPRTKTIAQVLAELDRLLELGYVGHVDFVDDNLIGNKKALKKFLPKLKEWQVAHRYPFMFSTEASVNLADDDELLLMMRDAGFFVVFVGIESGNAETLVSMQKKQNTRRSLDDSLHKIYKAGIFAIAGFILGFDTEGEGVAEEMIETIKATSIPICMIGLLLALPNTQLNRRLRKEGRLSESFLEEADTIGDQCTGGLNFQTIRPRRDIMRDYKAVLESVFAPKSFFARLRHIIDVLERPALPHKVNVREEARNLRTLFRLVVEITFRRPEMRREFWAFLLYAVRKNPRALLTGITNVLAYMHVSRFSRYVEDEMGRRIAAIDAEPPSPQPERREKVAA